MGCCLSQESISSQRNEEIERVLHQDALQYHRECKILLLGSGESGKSTIVKQMKIIHQDGYSHAELLDYRKHIFTNVMDSLRLLIESMHQLNIPFDAEENTVLSKKFLRLVQAYNKAEWTSLPPNIEFTIESIIQDRAIPSVMARRNEFYFPDSAYYFFNNIRRITGASYVPNEQDVLRARVKTTGIIETRFNMGELYIHMFDVGGQRSERKKWIHCFEAVTSIIFCVAINEYDQRLLEDRRSNRMSESLVLFESIINSKWFKRTSIILFLNKVDLFKEKLKRVPLRLYFKEYQGGNDVHSASRFLLSKFTQLNRAHLKLFPHLTCATDTSNIRLVFAAVKDTILQNALKDSGIL
ncbi:Guanine nucleotide-binding protein alpha-2 subunit [Coelomomyces lativittatus]|nr:Guanine nucleotide-binding protein alpha-2 subunit [Coelomomyces lativittatus]KAJ1509812.1 Guanine nucleotide-binding protein alpha-2 subunit [Coelomomyces lativittatus]KAJ1514585.1 Guanine nucleotide-binding protein alpha-2 subunit [Coelomomyces lativittatus]